MKLSRALFTTKLIFLLVILLRVPTVFGQGHESVAGHQTKHDYHQNLVSFLVGVAGESRHEYGITLGIGYERRVSDAFGVGILAERTSGDLDFGYTPHRLPTTRVIGNFCLPLVSRMAITELSSCFAWAPSTQLMLVMVGRLSPS